MLSSISIEEVASRPSLRYVNVSRRIFPWHSADGQYEAELERVLELRRASLSTFMLAVRKEIEGLWVELMMSDEEKDEFIGFIDGKSSS
jgi:hypothetical protein